MRVLFAIHGPPDPATAVYLTTARRAEFLARHGHTADILTPADLGSGRFPRLQPLVLPPLLARRDLSAYDVVAFHSHLAWAPQLRHVRGRPPASVILFHGLEPLYHEAVRAELRRTGERLSWRFDTLHRRVVPALLRAACRRADRVLCLNTAEREYLTARGWCEPARIGVVSNGVERELFASPREYRERATRLLFVGQWLRPKGTRYLAGAFEMLARRDPDVELTCAGTGAPAEVVRDAFAAEIRHRIRVLPRVTRDALRDELARADLFVFPSLSEGFSGALVEALAAGLPAVATPVGAAPDFLVDGRDVLFVPPADAQALARRVDEAMTDAARRRQVGTRARATAEAYEWDRVNAMFMQELLRGVGQA